MEPVTRYTTASGSVYEISGKRIRRVTRSAISVAERVGAEWREPLEIQAPGIGSPITMIWGTGRDEHSANAEQIGTEFAESDESITRVTQTTPVVEIA